MVAIRYKGQNYLVFGKYRIANGYTEIPDADFYQLMKSPTFAYRVNQRILEVPKDFPIEKPKEDSKNKAIDNEEVDANEKLTAKQLIQDIGKSEDLNYLNNLIKTDARKTVKDEAQSRIDTLNASKK
jgi:hypothetical protein